MKGQFVVTPDPEMARHPHFMTALGIKEERCEELCSLVDETIQGNPRLSVAEVLGEVSKHCENANELAFVSTIVGAHATPAMADLAGKLRSYFESQVGEEALHDGGLNN